MGIETLLPRAAFLFLFLFLLGCAQQTRSSSKRALLVIAPSDFRDEELFDTQNALEARGVETIIASTSLNESRGTLGGIAKPTLLIANANASDFDAVVFIGGSGVEKYALYENEDVLKLAREASSQNKVVGAICIAPRILASAIRTEGSNAHQNPKGSDCAGVVKGKRATSFPDSTTISMLKSAGANYTAKSVEIDGKLITANGPAPAREFGEAIADALD
ncbi:MAG: DJ-1/PfpI family protein [Candidatus Micrarchaeota archaeon]